MEIETSLFGKIQVSDEEIIDFPEGLIGLPDLKRFVLIEDEEKKPFQWLQSLDNVKLAFVVIEPKWLVPDIVFDISEDLAASLEIDSPENYQALAIVTIP
ncbi:MAG: flagellar assembly protein FliW, partial [Nitrospinota bacterium]